MTQGILAFVGGREWTEGCSFDEELLAAGGNHVTVLPTAAAYENPEHVGAQAKAYFAALGAETTVLPVLRHADAQDPEIAAQARRASFLYLAGGSALHLRSVLRDTALLEALSEAWNGGAVVAASAGAAMALCDPMIDPRGGAFTVGLGLLNDVAVIAPFNDWMADRVHRTLALAPAGLSVIGVDACTAAMRSPDGGWESQGVGAVTFHRDGEQEPLGRLRV